MCIIARKYSVETKFYNKMGAVLAVIGRIVTWAGASFVTSTIFDSVEPYVLSKVAPDEPQESKVQLSFFDKLKMKWRSILIKATISGIILFALVRIFKSVQMRKKAKF